MDDHHDVVDRLERRVAELEARLERLGATPPDPQPRLGPVTSDAPPSPTLARRHLLARGGTAALGAVLGGTAATVANAGPAAAATGTFDTATSVPALTATSTGPGSAVQATSTSTAPALVIDAASSSNSAIYVTVTGEDSGVLFASSEGYGALISAAKTGLWAIGDLAVSATGGRLGLLAYGPTAQVLLATDPLNTPMPAPPERGDQHEKGELYLDDDAGLWLCTADGSPGTWSRIGGHDTAGAFTALPTPVRVYDTRDGSGLPGADTGPVTGTRHGIDLTADASGLPTDATAAMVTLTVTDTRPDPNAYGQIYADALTTPPGTSTINWTDTDQLVATTTTTALTDGHVAVGMYPGANVLVDLVGYWR